MIMCIQYPCCLNAWYEPKLEIESRFHDVDTYDDNCK